MNVEPAHRLHTLLHNGKDCWVHTDGETKRYYRHVVETFLDPMSKVEIVEAERCQACHGRGAIQHPSYYLPGEQFVEPPSEDRCEDCLGTGAREVQEQSRKLERLADALAEADQEQTRTDDRNGDTRDGVMAAIVEAGLAPHVCDDDDLPDMVRHALTAAKKLAQPALWTYTASGEADNQAGAA